MSKYKHNILIFGLSSTNDQFLLDDIGSVYTVRLCKKESGLWQVLQTTDIHAIVFELVPREQTYCILKELNLNYSRVPVVAIGLDEPVENIARAFALGIKDYFKKPYQSELIIERLEALCSIKG